MISHNLHTLDSFFAEIIRKIFPQLEVQLSSDLALAILFGKVTFDDPLAIVQFLIGQIPRRMIAYNEKIAAIRRKLRSIAVLSA